MSDEISSRALMVGNIPFEPALDDLDELQCELEALPNWKDMNAIFEEALELAAWTRDALELSDALPLRCSPSLFGLMQTHTINQHRSKGSYLGVRDPLSHGIKAAISRWECPLLHSLSDEVLKLGYALGLTARVIKELAEWNPHPEEEKNQLERLDAKLNEVRSILKIDPIYESAAYFYRQELDARDFKNFQKIVKEEREKRQKARNSQSRGGSVGRPEYEWAKTYIKSNWPKIAYDDSNMIIPKSKLVKKLITELLPKERDRLNRLPNPEGISRHMPGVKAIRGNGPEKPGWLVNLGYNELPTYFSSAP